MNPEVEQWLDELEEKADWDGVIEVYQAIIALGHNYSVIWCNLGRAWDNKGDHNQAIECFKRATEIDPDFTTAWNSLGKSCYKKDDYDRAIECFNRVIMLDNNCADAWNNLGSVWYNKCDYDQAIECFTRAIGLNLNGVMTWFNIGQCWDKKSDYDQAISHYIRAIEIDPNYVPTWDGLGRAWAEKSDYDQAIECFNRAIELDHKYMNAWCNLGRAWYKKHDYDRAIECFKALIGLDPICATAWYNLGLTWNDKHDYDQAIECYNHVIKLDPNSAIAWNNLGNAWSGKHDYDQAIECYNHVIKLDPNSAIAWSNLGKIWNHKEDYDQAIVCFTRAIDLDPNVENAWHNLGNVWHHKTYYQEANNCYDRAISINKYLLSAWRGRESCLRSMGDLFEPRTSLGICECYEHEGDLDRAEEKYRELRKKTESNPNWRQYHLQSSLCLGRVHNKQEQFHTAHTVLDELKWNLDHLPENDENEANEKKKYLDISFELYRQLSIACHGENDLSRSFYYAELSKNFTLLSALQSKQKIKSKDKIPRNASIDQELVRYLPDEETALVEFFINDQKSYAFVLRKQLKRKHRLLWFDKVEETYIIDDKVIQLDIDSNSLGAMASIWQEAYHQFKGTVCDRSSPPAAIAVAKMSWFSTMNWMLSELYMRLFPQALRDQLAGIKKLIFVPTGPLYNIPLHALRWEEAGEARYLLDEFTVSYLPSASVLPYISKYGAEIRNWDNIKVFVGNTSGMDHVHRQVEAWRNKFEDKIGKKIKYDCDLAEHLLSALDDTQVAIYCGHAGCARNVNPLVSSYLMLKKENLYMEEIMNRVSLSGSLDLVLLSGCETAMTANERHDDYVGLPAAFYCAGAANVIGSLWSVEDGATYVLIDKVSDTFAEKAPWISRFIPKKIKHLVFQKESKADALRNASLLLRHGLLDDDDRHTYSSAIQSIRAASGPQGIPVTALGFLAAQPAKGEINFDEWQHPYYWAPFCCYGLG